MIISFLHVVRPQLAALDVIACSTISLLQADSEDPNHPYCCLKFGGWVCVAVQMGPRRKGGPLPDWPNFIPRQGVQVPINTPSLLMSEVGELLSAIYY